MRCGVHLSFQGPYQTHERGFNIGSFQGFNHRFCLCGSSPSDSIRKYAPHRIIPSAIGLRAFAPPLDISFPKLSSSESSQICASTQKPARSWGKGDSDSNPASNAVLSGRVLFGSSVNDGIFPLTIPFSSYSSVRSISFLRYFWPVIFFILRKLAVPLGVSFS